MRPAGRYVGITAAFFTLAALITAATGGSPVADRCKGGGWRHLAFRNQGECVSLAAHGGHIWNLADDFRVSPNQENPNPDFEGTPGVWRFLSSTGLERDPATYELYPNYTVVDTNREGWDGGSPVPTVSILKGIHRVFVHPGDGTLTVVGWRSPVTGMVLVRGLFEDDRSQTCVGSDGVRWAIDASTDTSTTSLASGVLDTNGSVGFALSTAVAEGDFLYFSVDPNSNAICDTTFLDLTISGPLKGD
jgi:hypothetical protein